VSWCTQNWCYIDPANCDRPHSPSASFENNTLDDGTLLTYSYAACGEVNIFESTETNPHEKKLRRFRDGSLRVSIPDYTGYLTHQVQFQPGRSFQSMPAKGHGPVTLAEIGMQGSFMELFGDIMKSVGVTTFTFVPVPMGNESTYTARGGSSAWTSCIHETVLNNTDVCICDAWVTAERLLLGAEFVRFLELDELRMVGRKRSAHGSVDDSWFWRPFLVWTTGLPDESSLSSAQRAEANAAVWACLVAVLIFTAAVLFLLEGHTNDESFPEKDSRTAFSHSVWYAIQGFAGQGDFRFEPHTGLGRLVVTSTALSLLIFMTTYGAVYTSSMVTIKISATGHYTDLSEAVANNARVCGWSAQRENFLALYPTGVYIPSDDGNAGLITKIDDGICDVALVTGSDAAWNVLQSDPSISTCDKFLGIRAEFSTPLALAVRSDLVTPFNSKIVGKKSDGTVAELEAQWKKGTMKPVLPCQDGGGATAKRVTAMDRVKCPLYIAFFGSLFALLSFITTDIARHTRGNKDELLDQPTLCQRFFSKSKRNKTTREAAVVSTDFFLAKLDVVNKRLAAMEQAHAAAPAMAAGALVGLPPLQEQKPTGRLQVGVDDMAADL
jgi:hypothetical protein